MARNKKFRLLYIDEFNQTKSEIVSKPTKAAVEKYFKAWTVNGKKYPGKILRIEEVSTLKRISRILKK